MKQQRIIQQMKKHDKNPQDQANEEEIGNLSEKIQEYLVKMIIKMMAKVIQGLGNKMDAQINEWRHILRRYKKYLTRT